ncbi:transcriptional regulator domain-containing protein [Oceanicella sp. SM1341]|uniref:transcriptional regulator domain-containing protein n=1 Tax=Oceanicella sp. SM1341 TaxID=1548889 RepID=UPI003516BEC1
MKPDTSRWRDRRSYDFFDRLNIEGLAWECLRRDEPYQDLYDSLVLRKVEMQPLRQEDERRWGLRFRGQTRPAGHGPAGVLVARRRSVDHALHSTPRPPAVGIISVGRRYCSRAR